MKILIRLLLLSFIALVGAGTYLQSVKAEKGDFYVGIGVLLLAFVLLPLFVYHRYKGKDLSKYSFKNMQGPEDKEPS
mgnify:FL=1|jgi:hypothetical protein